MAGKYGKGHEHLDDAAAAALFMLGLQPKASGREYMGMLIQDPNDGKYYRTGFQTDGNRSSSSYRGVYRDKDGPVTEDGYPVRGIVHNHPAERGGEWIPNTHFSPNDISTREALSNVPSYVAAMNPSKQKGWRSNDVVMGEDRASFRDTNGIVETAPGEEFLGEFPWEEFKQHLMRTLLERAPNDPRGLLR